MGNGTLPPRRPRRADYTPWAAMAVIGGLLAALMALASLGRDLQAGALAAVRWAAGLGGALALAGALALGWRRLRGRRGLTTGAWGRRRALWPAIVALLALAFASALLPIPYPSPWLSLLAPLLFVGGAAVVASRILGDATPMAYHRALRAYGEGDAQRALALVRQAAKELPDDALPATYGLQYLEAILLRERGDLAGAQAIADRLVARRPELYYGHAEQGLIRLAGGEARAACEALERAVERAPFLAEGHYNLSMARAEAGDAAGASEALVRALRLGLSDDVTRLIAHYQLHRAYMALGMAHEAAAERRWLRRRHKTLRRWRQTLAADFTMPAGRRQRDEELIAAVERVVAGDNRNPRTE